MGAEAGDRALETARCCTRKTCKLSGDSIPDLPESKPDCRDCDETGNCSKHPPLDPEAKADTWDERLAWKIASYLDDFPYVLPWNIAYVAALIQSAMNASIPMVQRATGRIIPDLTKREHVCEYQSAIRESAMNAQERELLRHNEALVQAAKAVLETAGVLRAYDVGGDSGDVKPFCEALNDLEDALGVLEGLSELRDGKTKPIEEVRAEAERLLAERGEER